jgi:hypothetical protein
MGCASRHCLQANFIGVTELKQIHVAPTVVNADYSTKKSKAIDLAESLAA